MNNIFEKLTNQMNEAIESGVSLALHSQNPEVDNIHILWGLVTNTNSILNQALNKMNIDKVAIELELKSVANNLPKSSGVTKESIKISRNVADALTKAEAYATSLGDQYIAVDSYLIANMDSFKQTIGKYLDTNELKKTLEAIRGGKQIKDKSGDENLESLENMGLTLLKKP